MAKNTDAKSVLGQLTDTLDLYLVKKAPFSLPDNVKEIIVNLAPWATIILMLIAIPGVLFVLGLGAVVAPFTAMMGPGYALSYGLNYTVAMIITAVAIVLELVAIPGLFKRSRKAWNLLFYASLVSLVSGILSGGLIGTIIGAVIGWYFLFQVRELYK